MGFRKGAEAAEGIDHSNKRSSPATPARSPRDAEAGLVERVKNGDRQASEVLIGRYQDRSFAIVLRMMAGDREKAMEITQEAFLTALRKIKTFEGQSSFFTWFYRILVNTCLDALRRRQRWRRLFLHRRPSSEDPRGSSDPLEDLPSPEAGSNPGSALDARELQRHLQAAMTRLSDRQRMIFQLKVFEEMRISEIAQTMGLAEGTVKSHLFRATQIVRGELAEWAEC